MDEISEMISDLKGPIAILGANGFIGKHLTAKIKSIRKDVLEGGRNNLWDVISKMPQTVFNLSAYGNHPYQEDRLLIYKTNFTNTLNILSFLEKQGVSAYVHAGTSAEYGSASHGSSEEEMCKPNTDYAVTKAMCAQLIWYLGKHKGLPVSNLRLFAVYGPGDAPSKLIPTIVEYGLQGLYPPTLKSSLGRDFIHVNDVCDAFIRAASVLGKCNYGESFNVGTGRSLTIRDVAYAAKEVFGISTNPKFIEESRNLKWDVSDSRSDTQKSVIVLGFRAKISFEEGLLSLANYEGQNAEFVS